MSKCLEAVVPAHCVVGGVLLSTLRGQWCFTQHSVWSVVLYSALCVVSGALLLGASLLATLAPSLRALRFFEFCIEATEMRYNLKAP